MNGKNRRSNTAWKRKLLALAVASCFATELAYAQGVGGTVVRGNATIVTQGNTQTITNTPGTVINWQGFSIPSQNIVQFLQQSSSSAVLNRVTGATPSTILGQLQSNGRVYLINPNGITIGQGAVIDVAGFVASSLNLSDADFIAGRHRFAETPGAGAVVNRGEIRTTTGGMVYLVGQNIENHGVIKTPQGEIVLAAGKTIELVDAGTPEIRVQISAPDNQALNLGQLFASGGRIGMYAGLVRHSGTANANTAVVGENGKIAFKAVKDVKLESGSVTTASGPTAGSIKVEAQTGTVVVAGTVEANASAGRGGSIDVSGQQGITIEPTGRVRANGVEGGTIALNSSGGPVQVSGQITADASAGRGGQVAIAAAAQATITAGARISASGTQAGGSASLQATQGVSLEAGSSVQANGSAGGAVMVSAEQGSVDVSGLIEAKGNEADGGLIRIVALSDISLGDLSILSVSGRVGGETRIEAREGTTLASGVIDASGNDGPGGKVLLLGPRVGLIRNSFVNASGRTGGGTVLVGGDYRGKSPEIQNADATYVGPSTVINADAVAAGDGGRVIVWGTDAARAYGTITARGGMTSGNGGFIETSGHYLDVAGIRIDASAINGNPGVWLLDPFNIEVVAGGGTVNNDGVPTFAPNGNDSQIGADLIEGRLDGGNNVILDTGIPGGQAGNITITASITKGVANASSLTMNAAGAIDINAPIDLSPGTGGLTLNAGGLVSFDALTSVAGALSVTANSITQSAALDVGGSVILSAGGITLNNASNVLGPITVNSGAGNVSIRENDAIIITSITRTSGDVTLNAGTNAITQSGAISIAGGALGLTGGDITLEHASNVFGDVTVNSGAGDVSLVDSGDLSVAGITRTSGDVTLNAGTNAITQSGAISIAGGALGLTGGDITLEHASNVFGDVTVNSGAGDVSLVDSGDLSVAGITRTSGDVTLNAGTNAITQSGAISIAGGALGLTGGDITLEHASNVFGDVTVNSGAGDVSLVDSGDLSVAGITRTSGDVTLNAGTNAITQSGAISIAGGALGLTGGDITLEHASNVFGDVTVNSGAGDVSLVDSGDLSVAGITRTSGDVTLNAGTNAITQSGAISIAGGALGLTGGDITLEHASNVFGDVTVNSGAGDVSLVDSGDLSVAGITRTSGDVTLNAGTNAITQSGAISIAGGALGLTGGDITLEHASNVFGDVTVNSGAGDVSLVDSGDLSVAGITRTSGDVTLNAGTNAITQSGAISIAGGALGLTGGDITLEHASNVFGDVTVNSGAGDVSLVDSGDLSVAGITRTSGDVTLNAGTNAITQSGAISIAGGALGLTGGDITLEHASNVFGDVTVNSGAGDVSLVDSGDLSVAGITRTSGDVTLNAGTNAITQSGAISIAGGALGLTGGDITLEHASNVFGDVTVNSGAGDVSLVDSGDLSVAGITRTSGDVTLNAGTNAITQSGAISIAGGALGLTGGDITLEHASNVFGDVTVNSGAGDVSLVDSGDLSVAGITRTSGDVTLNAGTNAITQSGAISIAGGALGLTGGDITLEHASNVFGDVTVNSGAGDVSLVDSGDLSVAGITRTSGDVTLNAGTNAITQSGAISIAGGALGLTGGDITLEHASNVFGDVTVNSGAGDVSLVDSGDLSVAGITRTSGDVTLNAGTNAITQSGAISIAGGALGLTGGDITLEHASNVFGDVTVNSGAGDVSLVDSGDLSVAGITRTSGDVTLNAGTNAITQSGAISIAGGALGLTGGDITLEHASNVFGDVTVNSGAGDVSLVDSGDLSVAGITRTSGDVTLNAGTNAITQSGAISIAGGALGLTGGDITLEHASNVFGDVTVNSGAGDVSLVDSGDLSVAGITRTSGDVTLNAGTNAITQSGAISIAGGALGLTGGDITLEHASNVFGDVTVNSGAGDVSLVDSGDLSVAGITRTSGDVTLNAGTNAITQSGAISIAGGALGLTGGDITLEHASNVFGDVTVNSGAGDVSLVDSGDLSVAGITRTSGDVTLNAGTNAITQSGAISIAGGALGLTGGDITLEHASNVFGDVTVNSGAGDVSLRDSGALTIAGIIRTGGNLTLQAGGNVTQSGAIDVDGLELLGTGAYTLTHSGNDVTTLAGNVSNTVQYSDINGFTVGAVNTTGLTTTGVVLSAGGTLTLAENLSGGAGNVRLITTANMDQTGGVITANELGVRAATGVNLAMLNDADTVAIANNTSGAVTYRDSDGFAIGTVTALGAFTPAVSGISNPGRNVTLAAGGLVTQAAPSDNVIASGLELLGTGSYALTNTGNNVATIAANGPSGVSYTDSNALTVGTVNTTIGMNVGGNIELTTLGGGAGTLTISNDVTTTNNGNVVISNAGLLTVNANINADGDVIQNGAGIIELDADIITTNDLVQFAQPVLLTSGPRLIDTSGAGVGGIFGGRIHFVSTLNGGGNSLTMVTPGVSGDILFDGAVSNLAALTITNAANVTALPAASISTNAGGAINITAQGIATFGGAINSGGAVTLRVNDLVLNSTISAGANPVQITPAFVPPATSAQAITIGAAGPGLQLSQAELNSISTTGLLTIGDSTHTGPVTIAGPITTLPGATGGFTILNNTGGIAVNAPITYTSGAGNLTLKADGGGATAGAITDNGSGLVTATNLTLNAATGIGTTANPLHVTGTNLNVNNTTSGGVFLQFPSGDLTLAALASGAGTVSLSTTDGSINVNGSLNAGGAVELTANATGATPRILDINAPIAANGKIILRAADDISIDAQVSSGGGDVYVVAGRAGGMNLPGITMADGVTPVTPAGETVGDTDGGITINNRVIAGAGNIVMNATESIVQPSGVGGNAGLQNTGALIVRTYNDTAGAGSIDLRNDNNPNGNSNGPVTLETRMSGDTSAPGAPVSGGYAASNMDYRSYTGVVISTVGTSGDVVIIAATQDVDIVALNLQVKNLTLIANAGDVNFVTQVTNDQINQGNPGGSLVLLASGDVNVLRIPGTNGVTIGRVLPSPTLDPATGLPVPASIEKFDHELKLVAQGNINVQGSIYVTGDLHLRANASPGETGNPQLPPTYVNNGGSVNISVPSTDPVVVSARNIIVGTRDGAGRPLPVQNLTLTGGNTPAGAGVRQSTHASLEAAGTLDIFLTGDMTLTGGTVDANNPVAGTVIENSAVASVGGGIVTIRGIRDSDNPGIGIPALNSSNIILTGGTATATNQGAAEADASALILALQSANINIGGDMTIQGGSAIANGANAAAIAIAGTEIGTQITGNELLTIAARNVFVLSGTATPNPVTGGSADGFASLLSSGAIRISTTGTGPMQGLVLDGAGGSGLFDALGTSLIRVSGASYPITVSGQVILLATGQQDATVIAGAPLIDDSLLAAFLRATESAREETLGQDPNLQRDPKGQAGVCK